MARPVRRIMRDDGAPRPAGPRAPIPDDAVEVDVATVGVLERCECWDGDRVILTIRLSRPIADPADENQALANVAAKAAVLAPLRALVNREALVGVEGRAPIATPLPPDITRTLVDRESRAVAERRQREFRERLMREYAERMRRDREGRQRAARERGERLRAERGRMGTGLDRLDRVERELRGRSGATAGATIRGSIIAAAAAGTTGRAARCTGASPCRACSDCSRCAHCNGGGGTCGVCSAAH